MQILNLDFHFVIESSLPVSLQHCASQAIYCHHVVDRSAPRGPNLVSREKSEWPMKRRAAKSGQSVCTGNGVTHESRQSLQVCFDLGAIPV